MNIDCIRPKGKHLETIDSIYQIIKADNSMGHLVLSTSIEEVDLNNSIMGIQGFTMKLLLKR